MPKMQSDLLVLMEGQREPYPVTSDQRDLAAWEAHKDYRPLTRHLVARFVAWSAMRRNEQYDGTWHDFNTRDCLEVESLVVDDGQEDEQGLDPGTSTTGGTT